MIEQIKETKQVIAETVVANITKCDVCGKMICDSRYSGFGAKIQDHYELRTGHYDWGNDSCESAESFDICSKECLQKKFDEYVEKSSGGTNTKYFEVDHSWHYMEDNNDTY